MSSQPHSPTSDRRQFLGAVAVTVAAGPVPLAPGRLSQKELGRAAREFAASERHADLLLLVGAMKFARDLADAFWQNHPERQCHCRGCHFRGVRLSRIVERYVLPLLEIALEQTEGECDSLPDLKTFEEDVQRLGELHSRRSELWGAERDENGAVIPWR
ncbi:MAG TPA: twin-arginine translocation signal domain-containing protein [Fimbriiglobus sp.]|nr:twin-arginine translocation signal domain-containing protein [Fimbriiglobus sp.]